MTTRENIDKFLQPLRIPAGWKVDYNILTEFDPLPENMEFFYGEWLFGATHSRNQVGIEVHFEPEGDPGGEYVVDFFRYHNVNPKPAIDTRQESIQCVSTSSRIDVVRMIEEFMSRQTTIKR